MLSAPLLPAAHLPSGDGAGDATVFATPPPIDDAGTIVSSVPTLGSGAFTRVSSPAASAGGGGVLLAIGTVLGGRYEILELLGQGGMGAVYKVADREVDRLVALKVIRPEMAQNPEILARSPRR